MNTTYNKTIDQAQEYISVNSENGMLSLPTRLNGFKQTHFKQQEFVRNEGTKANPFIRKRIEYSFLGSYEDPEGKELRKCPVCGALMHKNGTNVTRLRHLPFGDSYTVIEASRVRYRCTNCEHSEFIPIGFKTEGHLITEQLKHYTESLLAYGHTLKSVANITGLNKSLVKDIDKVRLEALYVREKENGRRELIKPEVQARYLGIDEFKLHDGYKYATHITDLETGCILWIQAGKKKKVVYDFIEHVGLEWMSNVIAISADMNSDFEEAFKEKCPHLKIVYDYFHIVKNFNEKVVSEVRKDEQRRLIEEGNEEAAEALKGSKYILTSSRNTLLAKDDAAHKGEVISKGSELFKKDEVKQTGGQMGRYLQLLSQNTLLFNLDYVKTILNEAYKLDSEEKMTTYIDEIISYCKCTENCHFKWFANLLENHKEGIVSHAKYRISNGKIEGINQKIKTIRRQSYGLPDDEYFFLKLFDASRQKWNHSLERSTMRSHIFLY